MGFRKRERLLVICAALCFGALAADSLIISPLTDLWKRRTARIAQLEQDLVRGHALVKREKTMVARWDEMKKRSLSGGQDARLQQSEAEDKVLKSLTKWAESSRLGVSSLKPRWTRSQDDQYMKLECRVDMTGNIISITRFLYELERDPLALSVEELEITSRDDGGRQLTMHVLFSGLMLLDEKKQQNA